MNIFRAARRWMLPLVVAIAGMTAAGCRTAAMKGTPFYTGEYGRREGPVENRVNLWPLVYYRDPALSVLWPFYEHADEHWALRPLVSVYGLDRPAGQREINVLWPLAQFDGQSGRNRIFPVYWGNGRLVLFPLVWWEAGADGHAVVFPLYWDLRGGGQHENALFPLWIVHRERAWALWPLVRWSRPASPDRFGHVGPFYGFRAKRDGSARSEFWLWPLGGRVTRDRGAVRAAWFAPLFYQRRDPSGSRFVSPLWSQRRDAQGHWRWQLAPPFFFRSRGAAGETFVSLPWMQQRDAAGRRRWCVAPPFYACWRGVDGRVSRSVLLLYGQSRAADGALLRRYLFPLAWFERRPGGAANLNVLLLYQQHHAAGGRLQSVQLIPFFGLYRDTGVWWCPLAAGCPREGTFFSWLCGWRKPTANRAGFVYPLTPLAGWRTGRDAGGWLFPVFWRRVDRASGDGTVRWLLLGGYARRGDRRTVSFWPLFSWTRLGPLEAVSRSTADYASGGVDAWCLPLCWYENVARRTVSDPARPAAALKAAAPPPQPVLETRRRFGIFPLMSYERTSRATSDLTQVRRGGTILWRLFDWNREQDVRVADGRVEHDYVRRRVLWHVWHFERLNGDVSLDVLPGITWDRRRDGYRQFSLLWRLVRYERQPDGRRALDLLFIPIVR